MKYALALAGICIAGAAHAQSTGDATKDAQIQALWASCKNAPQTDFVHVCFRDMTTAAHLYTQAKASQNAPKAATPTK